MKEQEKDSAYYLSEYIKRAIDGVDKYVFPELLSEDGEIDKDCEIIHFFDSEYSWDPKLFFIELYTPTCEKYAEYFSIFDTPFYRNDEHNEFRFSKLLAPIGFKNKLDIFLNKYRLNTHGTIFLHLIASCKNQVQYFNNEFTKEHLQLYKAIDKEFSQHRDFYQCLKQYIHSPNKTKLIDCYFSFDVNGEIKKFSFKHHTSFKSTFLPIVMVHDQYEKLRQPSGINIKNDFPYHDDMTIPFYIKLSKALNNFLKKECSNMLVSNTKTNTKIIDTIFDFFDLCNFVFYDVYERKLDKTDSESVKKCKSQIKTWILRADNL